MVIFIRISISFLGYLGIFSEYFRFLQFLLNYILYIKRTAGLYSYITIQCFSKVKSLKKMKKILFTQSFFPQTPFQSIRSKSFLISAKWSKESNVDIYRTDKSFQVENIFHVFGFEKIFYPNQWFPTDVPRNTRVVQGV